MHLMLVFVRASNGQLVPREQYTDPIEADTEMAVEFNPIYAAWIRNNIPPGADPSSHEMRGRTLDFIARFTSSRLGDDLAAELEAWGRAR